MMLSNFLKNSSLIALGGAIGSLCRYWASLSCAAMFGKDFPYGTMFVNVTGSFLMGFLAIFLLEHVVNSHYLRALLLIGFLGGYTTFSSFSVETMFLLENGRYFLFALNIFLNLGLCLSATSLGLIVARTI